MTTDAAQQSDDIRYEVARYLDESRAIYAQVIDDGLEVTDVSLTGGRHYVIEPRVTEEELAPLVLDYIVKAAELGGRCPMCNY
jgi:hypothetical protein